MAVLGFDFLVTGTLLTLAAAQGQPAQNAKAQNLCPLVKTAQINVSPTTKQVQYNTSRTLEQMQQTEVDTINPYGFHGVTMTQGYMQGQISMKPQIKLGNNVNQQTGVTCIWYDTINVPIEIEPVIFVAKEVYADACMRKAVIDHEMKHVNVDRKIVNQFAKDIGQKIYKALEERGFRAQPVSYENAQPMADRMNKVVSQVIEFEYKKFELLRAEEPSKIDSLEEYERMSALCPDYRNKAPAWASSTKTKKTTSAPSAYRPSNR